MIADLHLHTRLSPDAPQNEENNLHALVEKAKELGLKYIAITEHQDLYTTHDSLNADLDECAKQVREEKRNMLERACSEVTLLHGVELAHAHENRELADSIISRYDFDFILGSMHKLKCADDFYFLRYSELSDEALITLFDGYLTELYDIASCADFDSFAHCIYALRYYSKNKRLPDICAAPSLYRPKNAPCFAEIFEKLISRGKALEINTSGVKINEFTLPTYDLVKLYYDMGGRHMTIGSDSHETAYLGSGIDVAEQMLKDIGFPGVTVFAGRQQRIIPFN